MGLGDHGEQVQADPRWSTTWPHLLKFVGTHVRTEVKNLAEAAIVSFLADRHYTALDFFQRAIVHLYDFPTEEQQKKQQDKSSEAQQQDQQPKAAASAAAAAANEPSKKDDHAEIMPTEMGHRAAADFIRASRELQQSTMKVRAADELLAEASLGNTTWKKVNVESNGDGIYYRAEEGLTSQSFRVIGTMKDTPIMDLACLLLELDMFKEWFPLCCRSKQVGCITRFERCATFEISCPWPMDNREVALWGFAVDDMERTRRTFICAKDHLEPIGGVTPPGLPKGCTRLRANQVGYILEAVDPTTTRVVFVSNIDPMMEVPAWLLNWATGKFCSVLMWQMQRCAKAAREPKSPYMARKQHKIYEEFQTRVSLIDFSKPPLQANGEPVSPLRSPAAAKIQEIAGAVLAPAASAAPAAAAAAAPAAAPAAAK